ncbi:MAG: SPASM domain-containing protein [Methanobacteriota archaeon]|nr:MAG: SPASM domain-containing protein [Euryarchaeota archaeon]
MSIEDIDKAFRFIDKHVFHGYMNVDSASVLDVQYVGGDILVVDRKTIDESISLLHRIFGNTFAEIKHGVQSNLVGSKDRIKHLVSRFGKSIGTSEEFGTSHRMVGGSSTIYQRGLDSSLGTLKVYGIRPGCIYVLMPDTMDGLIPFLDMVQKKRRYPKVVIRHVFDGGIKGMDSVSVDMLLEALIKSFDNWFLKADYLLEPHWIFLDRLLHKPVNRHQCISGCPFQRDCVRRSIDLEPNGDIYLCLDMADSGNMKIGNALDGTLNIQVVHDLERRIESIDKECFSCPAYTVCQGGCMNESVNMLGNHLAKSPYCKAWKGMVHHIQNRLSCESMDQVVSWMKKVEEQF